MEIEAIRLYLTYAMLICAIILLVLAIILFTRSLMEEVEEEVERGRWEYYYEDGVKKWRRVDDEK